MHTKRAVHKHKIFIILMEFPEDIIRMCRILKGSKELFFFLEKIHFADGKRILLTSVFTLKNITKKQILFDSRKCKSHSRFDLSTWLPAFGMNQNIRRSSETNLAHLMKLLSFREGFRKEIKKKRWENNDLILLEKLTVFRYYFIKWYSPCFFMRYY